MNGLGELGSFDVIQRTSPDITSCKKQKGSDGESLVVSFNNEKLVEDINANYYGSFDSEMTATIQNIASTHINPVKRKGTSLGTTEEAYLATKDETTIEAEKPDSKNLVYISLPL